MRRKVKIAAPFVLTFWVASLFVSVKLGLIIAAIGILLICVSLLFFLLNELVKKTNWWKNQYLATEQFVSNVGYRDDIIRNYEVVNLGSNPAHFAFFYEGIKGQSWATGSQGQDMDFELLKYFHSYLKKRATVIIPVMPFTAISPYLTEHSEYWGMAYYSKFARLLDRYQVSQLPYGNSLLKYLRFPIIYNFKAIRYIIRDIPSDSRYQIAEQPMMEMELEQDANGWIKSWLKEFSLRNLSDVKDKKWERYYKGAVTVYKQMIDFCIERDLKPVFICVPMTKHLSKLFPDDFREFMITRFVREANERNVPFLDYTFDERFQNDELYFNSFFLNLRGRKLFTQEVLKDLRINNNDENVFN